MKNVRIKLGLTMLISGFLAIHPQLANASTLFGQSPYLEFDDSPFSGGNFDYFFLEDFEDGLLNVPGVSANTGGVTSVVFGPTLHDSVDADDGAIDGSGLLGDSYFSPSGSAGILFTFDVIALGALPNSAGLVWTDGAGTTSFEAFGPGGVSLGAIGPVSIADNTFAGTTSDDRFFGIEGMGEIESIFISNSSLGIEIDHLQFGLANTPTIPTPAVPTPALLPGLIGFGMSILRKKQKATQEA